MKRTVSDQIRTNITYWNEEIPKEVRHYYKTCLKYNFRMKEKRTL